jgi:hypothetical protein
MDNNSFIHIKGGLNPGDIITLLPPVRVASAIDIPDYEKLIDIPEGKPFEMKPIGKGGKSSKQGDRGGGGKDRGPKGGDFIERYDTDGDGIISREEFTGPADSFDRTDQDGDGIISSIEAASRPRRPPGEGRGKKPAFAR